MTGDLVTLHVALPHVIRSGATSLEKRLIHSKHYLPPTLAGDPAIYIGATSDNGKPNGPHEAARVVFELVAVELRQGA